MMHVHPDEAVRSAAQAVDDRMTTWRRSLPLRDDVATAVARYAATPDGRAIDGEERRLLERWQLDLGRAGHDLPPEPVRRSARSPPASSSSRRRSSGTLPSGRTGST